MIKFTKIDSILNFVSSAIKEQEDVPQLLQWANQAYRKLHLPNIQYDLKTVVVEVANHKATLPTDVKKIVGVWYTTAPLPETSYDIVVEVDNVDRSVILQQQLLLSSPWKNTFVPLRYIGQNRSSLIDENLYCNRCGNGFSIDSSLKCITVDVDDTSLILEYYATMKDTDCSILVPDDVDLLTGLAYHASSKLFMDRADRNMEGAANRSREYLMLSQNHLNRFRGKMHLMNLQPSLHEQFRKSRFDSDNYWKYQRNYNFNRKSIS